MQNVYALFCEPEEASVKHMKTQMYMRILNFHRQSGGSQASLAKALSISSPRVCDLLKGHLEKFSLEMLHRFCLRLKLEGLK